jgi:hypothetical protein
MRDHLLVADLANVAKVINTLGEQSVLQTDPRIPL